MQDDETPPVPAPRKRLEAKPPAPPPPVGSRPEEKHQEGAAIDCPVIHPLFAPGGISILSGATGIGKTALIAGWIARILAGHDLFKLALTTSPTAIAVIVTDRTRRNTKYWFEQAGVLDQIRLYCLQDDFSIDWSRFRKAEQHAKLFAEALDKFANLPTGTLLFVDPLSVYLGGKLSDYGWTAAAIGPLGKIAAQRGLTIVGTHHVPKASNDPKDKKLRPQDRVLGSTAIAAYTNTQFFLIGPEELTINPKLPATHYAIGYVSHEHPSYTYNFKRGSTGLFEPWDSKLKMKPAEVVDQIEVRDPADERLDRMRDLFPGDKVVATSYIIQNMNDRYGIKQSQAYNDLAALIELGEVEKVGQGQVRKVKMN